MKDLETIIAWVAERSYETCQFDTEFGYNHDQRNLAKIQRTALAKLKKLGYVKLNYSTVSTSTSRWETVADFGDGASVEDVLKGLGKDNQ